MKGFFTITLLLFISNIVFSQSIEEIKADKKNYIWGEGYGITLNQADKQALSSLISQISTSVESSSKLSMDEVITGGSSNASEKFKSVINTYSEATLKNTERIVITNEPEAQVFRYIKRSEISKVFEDRKNKVLSWVENAENSIENNKVADALRYYYWSLVLLKSHPDASSIVYYDTNGKKQILITWLPYTINEILSDIDFKVINVEKNDTYNIFNLYITYNGNPVDNFDFSYFDGSNWSNIYSANNGLGSVELYGISKDASKIRVKAEYLFENETKMDNELFTVFSKIKHVPFRKSYYNIKTSVTTDKELPVNSSKIAALDKVYKIIGSDVKIKSDVADVALTEVKDDKTYKESMNKVIAAVKTKNYNSVKSIFTNEGYNEFNALIKYGNARVIGNTDMKFISYKEKVICRSIPMNFKFKTNNKQFIENVVFQFDKTGKIEDVNFALSKVALDNIVTKTKWSEHDRMLIVSFLERYKTAYALKNIDYIESIYADDALIITGTVIKIRPTEANRYKDNKIIKYNKVTKTKYIRNLKFQFANKEFINLKFEESRIRKGGKGGNVYGIQIKQSYVSSNYGDVGYLFLMIDLNDTSKPKIEVRTWQPEAKLTTKSELYNLSSF